MRKLPWLNGGRNAVLCRGDAWTRQWFDRTAVTLMKLGCDMVQVDQVVGGQAPGNGECFSTEHGHPQGPGVWDAEAFATQLRSLATECRRVQPGAVLSIEEPQELFNHLIGIQDYRDAQSSRWPQLPGLTHASIFGYLYHEFLPVFQSNPQRGDLRELAYCAVTGQIPHWVAHWPVTPSPTLVNGGFEEWTEDVPVGWQRVTGWQGTNYLGRSFRDDTIKVQGTASMRLENRLESDIVQVSQNVSVGSGHLQIGHTYRLRLRAKVEQLARPNAINLAALTPQLGFERLVAYPVACPRGLGRRQRRVHDAAGSHLPADHAARGRPLPDLDRRSGPGGTDRRPMATAHAAGAAAGARVCQAVGRAVPWPGSALPDARQDDPSAEADRSGSATESRPPFAPIMVNAYRAVDGSEAAIIANATDAEQTVRFQWQQETQTLQMAPWTLRLVE